jgi:hypothetical protein
MQWGKQIWNLNMLDWRNKRLKGKYEINTGLPLGKGSWFRVRERDSSGCLIDLGLARSRSGWLGWCPLHLPHLLCFLQWWWSRWGFSGGVLDFRLLSPLALLIGFNFLGWWHILNPLSCSQCFLIVVMRLSALGLVRATFSFFRSDSWLTKFQSHFIVCS